MKRAENYRFLLSPRICKNDLLSGYFMVDYNIIEETIKEMLDNQKDGYADLNIFIDKFNLKVDDRSFCQVKVRKDLFDEPYIHFVVTREPFIVEGEDEECYVVEFAGDEEG